MVVIFNSKILLVEVILVMRPEYLKMIATPLFA